MVTRLHLLVVLPLALGAHALGRRLKDRLGFVGLNLHVRDGELRFVLHPLHIHPHLQVGLLPLGIGHETLLLTRGNGLLLHRIRLDFARFGIEGFGELLQHLPLLRELLLELLRVRLFGLVLERRREEFLDPRGGFVMSGEIAEFQIQIPQNRKQGRVGLEELPHFVGPLQGPRLVAAPDRHDDAIPPFPEVVIPRLGRHRRHAGDWTAHGRSPRAEWRGRHPLRRRERPPWWSGSRRQATHTGWRHGSDRPWTLGARIAQKRGIQQDRLRLVFLVEDAGHPAGTVINTRNQVENDLGFIGEADLGQVVEEVRAALLVLLLQGEDRPATPRGLALLAQGALEGTGSLMDEFPRLLEEHHRRTEPGRIDLRPLRRGRGRAVEAHVFIP